MTGTPQNNMASVSFSRKQWRAFLDELARRGGGLRESGAFLLSRLGHRSVDGIEYFDDLDAQSLWGGVTMSRDAFAKLSERCRTKGLVVIADVHTHPSDSVRQSHIDSTNPMVRIAGHVAIIVPNFAVGRIRPSDTGVHIYEGEHRWTSAFDRDAKALLKLTSQRRA